MKNCIYIAIFLCASLSLKAQTGSSANSGKTMDYIVGTIYVEMTSQPEKQPTEVNNILFSPNPVKDILSFNGSPEVKSVIIFDLNGRKVFESKVKDNSVNLGILAKGCYVMVTDIDTSKGYKLLKE